MSPRPNVVLFDIGGVCVVSPMQAILDYEKKQNIPLGWINHAISASSPNGSWQRLERGEIPLDETFFRLFHADLTDEKLWKQFHIRKDGTKKGSAAVGAAPPGRTPDIDAEWLYWEMMRISRSPDPTMFPALKRLRKIADTCPRDQRFVIGALSNTSIFPASHEFSREDTREGRFNKELKSLFDVFVSSAHVGMRKPDRDIYEYAIRAVDRVARDKGIAEEGVRIGAGDIVFLDDIGGNLRTAREVGMRTIKVVLGRVDLAVQELEGIMGVKVSGGSKL